MVAYHPIDILKALFDLHMEVGRDNASAPVKGGKRFDYEDDWENSDKDNLPSVEFIYNRNTAKIRSLDTSFRDGKEEVRLKVRAESEGECWEISQWIEDVVITECKNFTTLTGFSNMDYSFLEFMEGSRIEEYSEDVNYWLHDILVIFEKPKVYTIN
jgi:hypothetical protein